LLSGLNVYLDFMVLIAKRCYIKIYSRSLFPFSSDLNHAIPPANWYFSAKLCTFSHVRVYYQVFQYNLSILNHARVWQTTRKDQICLIFFF